MPVGEVLQSTTPILLCTTTTPYCKVLLQYYPVLQSTTPVTLFSQSTTTYYSSTAKYYSSTTLYYNVLLQYYLCTTKYNSSTTLSYKVALIIDPPHIWNVIYNARNNKRHPPTSPNTASATKNESQDWSCLHLKRHLPCVEQQHSPSNLTKYCACHAKWHSKIGRKSTE